MTISYEMKECDIMYFSNNIKLHYYYYSAQVQYHCLGSNKKNTDVETTDPDAEKFSGIYGIFSALICIPDFNLLTQRLISHKPIMFSIFNIA